MRLANAILVALILLGQTEVWVLDCYPKTGVVIEPNGQGVYCMARVEGDSPHMTKCERECVVNVYVTFDADRDGDVDLADFGRCQERWTGPSDGPDQN